MVLLDRFEDMHTMLSHAWAYLPLIQEIFTINENKFEFTEDYKAPKESAKRFEIDLCGGD